MRHRHRGGHALRRRYGRTHPGPYYSDLIRGIFEYLAGNVSRAHAGEASGWYYQLFAGKGEPKRVGPFESVGEAAHAMHEAEAAR